MDSTVFSYLLGVVSFLLTAFCGFLANNQKTMQREFNEFKIAAAERYVTRAFIEPEFRALRDALGGIEKQLARMEGRAEAKAEGHG